MIRVIIPCAGFGTRMNMEKDESKEMLYDKNIKGPVIQYSLDLCNQLKLTPLVVTRPEKLDLIKYCNNKQIDVLVIDPTGEWPRTVLKSANLWTENNIMILPDTRFSPDTLALSKMRSRLQEGHNFSIAIHTVSDPSKWCMIKRTEIVEKPSSYDSDQAMGMIGFKKFHGHHLFHALDQKSPYELKNAAFVRLDSFKDITRTGKIE